MRRSGLYFSRIPPYLIIQNRATCIKRHLGSRSIRLTPRLKRVNFSSERDHASFRVSPSSCHVLHSVIVRRALTSSRQRSGSRRFESSVDTRRRSSPSERFPASCRLCTTSHTLKWLLPVGLSAQPSNLISCSSVPSRGTL